MKKNITLFLIIISIFLLVFVSFAMLFIFMALNVKNNPFDSKPALETEISSNPTISDFSKEWAIATNASLGHTFKHPKEATIETRESESVVVFMGEIQSSSGRTQTELFDGYIFRISKMELEPGMTTEMFAQQQRQSAQTECVSDTGAISPLKTISVNSSLEVVQYSVQGCRTDYTDSFATIDGATYLFSQLYVGAPGDKAMYKEITDQILSTVRIL